MKLLLLAATTLTLALMPAQEPTTFTEEYLGLQFTHPAGWKVTKKAKDRTYISIPVQGSSEPAELQLVRTTYHGERDLFQDLQKRVNEDLKRTVVRQWEQEILGVPMLFSRINYSQDGTAKSVLTGLFYTRTPLKLLVRLTSREADYDNVSYEFQQAMETLRTTDGKLPLPDSPNIKLDPTPTKPTKVPDPPKVIDSEPKQTNMVKATQSAEMTVSTRKINLRYPDGWTADEVQGNKVVLKHSELAQPLVVEIFFNLDSDPANKTLFKASSKSLALFNQVSSREDKAAAANKAGTLVTSVWRTGKTEKGEAASYEAVGQAGEYYFLLTYRQTDMAAYKNERRIVEALVDLLSIEPVP